MCGFGAAEFMVDVDTTVPEQQQHMLRSGIPPALNLAGLLQTLSWAVEASHTCIHHDSRSYRGGDRLVAAAADKRSLSVRDSSSACCCLLVMQDGRVKMTEAEARRLLCCTLLLSIDRYLQVRRRITRPRMSSPVLLSDSYMLDRRTAQMS